jgi:hypothetical protein
MANKEIVPGLKLGSWGTVVIPRTVTKQEVTMVLQAPTPDELKELFAGLLGELHASQLGNFLYSRRSDEIY